MMATSYLILEGREAVNSRQTFLGNHLTIPSIQDDEVFLNVGASFP